MAAFMSTVNTTFHKEFSTYAQLHEWSVENPGPFWESVWAFIDVLYSHPHDQVVDDATKMPGASWFTGARLNYPENLLRFKDDRTALIFYGEDKVRWSLTYEELFLSVAKCAKALKDLGIKKGDRVAGFMPNRPETIIAMLATASMGAIWSSSSPDFGIKGVLDRFTQIEPKVLFAANGYYYNGKSFDSLEKLQGILDQLPSVEKVIITPYTESSPDTSQIGNAILFSDFVKNDATDIDFEQLPFDHPLYIMYSSGTTGLPKSIVHSAGGTLIQHLKELRLHTDLKREDTIFYFTTCGWMMWNWLVTSLALGSTLVLYDGSPFYPDGNALWKMAEETGITVFGTSAKYISACEQFNVEPGNHHDLSKLRAILSTGSPLMEENFDYVYDTIKKDVQLASISGGTDIVSCFALGNPMLPVYRGELQCCGLGMDVHAYDAEGNSIQNAKGELVCKTAFPSMPTSFWNDPSGEKYHNAYFSEFGGIWHHGDFITINNHGGVQIFGRSDATLNPGGVRIGTAEIYRVVETIPGVDDSLVVGQQWKDDERVILFVKMTGNQDLTDPLRKQITSSIRTQCSPRHVPAIIIPVDDIPYTINGKKVEIAVKKIIHGEEVKNQDALTNPECLEYYRDIQELA